MAPFRASATYPITRPQVARAPSSRALFLADAIEGLLVVCDEEEGCLPSIYLMPFLCAEQGTFFQEIVHIGYLSRKSISAPVSSSCLLVYCTPLHNIRDGILTIRSMVLKVSR